MQIVSPGECWRFNVDAVALRNGTSWQAVSGRSRILVLGGRPKIATGDRVRCFVRLSAPSCPHNPGERDWAAYLRADRIRTRLLAESPECLTVIERGSPWTPRRWLERLRAHGRRMFERYLDPRQAELASAVLLGLREELDRSRVDAFFTTGTIHLLCISGLHVGILAGALFWIVRRTPLPRGWAVALIATTILLYALMVDARPSVIRATVLVLVACMAWYFGRRALSMNSLAAAALVVLVLNPAHLFSVGAQLSFLCVAVLIWFTTYRPHGDQSQMILDRLVMQNLGLVRWSYENIKRGVIGLILAGALLWLLTSPLVTARFHIFSLVAIVLNPLLWLPMSFSVLSGFIVLLCGTVCPPLGYLCGWLCNGSLWVLEWSVNAAHRLPYSHFWVPGPADWWLWGFYGGLGLLWAFPRWRPSRRRGIALLAGWIAVGFVPALWPQDRDRLDCTFLSMGHGCAVLLELPSGRTMLYDAGRFGSPSAGVRAISECLWHRGISRLDTVVLSHPDIDHYNALPGLLEKFSVGEVCVSPLMFEKDAYTVGALRGAIERHGVPVREVQAGDRLADDRRCTIDVLYPRPSTGNDSDNANSVVLAIGHRGRRILLTGDLETSGLADLLSERPRQCEVLLAPHHGSRKSNSPELAAWAAPDWVVFSGDGRWSFPEIEAPYRAVGGRIFHTHADGAIHVRIDPEGVHVSPFLEQR